MAETQKLEREYIINLRREFIRVPQYRRTEKAIKAIKKFIAKHMKVPNRDESKVKLDVYFNNELWFRGRTNPPSKIKVKAVKEGDIVKVNFVDAPKHIAFLKAKHDKIHSKSEVKGKTPEQTEKKLEEKSEEDKKLEQEKEKSVEQQNIQEAKKEAKSKKHLTNAKSESYHRMALQK